jgi:malate permease and related proteins
MAPELILVLALLALGWLARKLGRFGDGASDVLNRFVIDLCVPAVVLRLVPTLEFRASLVALVATPWLLALVALLVVRLAERQLRLDRATAAVLFLCLALGNTSFLGFPLCSALLGDASLSYAAVYDQLGSFLLLSTVSPVIIARAAGGAQPSVAATLRRVLTFPPFIALVLALLPLPRPAFVDPVLRLVAAALVPVGLFAVGLRLRLTPPRELSAFTLGLVVKLGLFPLLAWGIALLFDPPRAVFEVVVLESAMPAMITAGALAMAAGLAPELAAALVGWGVLAALITVPAWASLLR